MEPESELLPGVSVVIIGLNAERDIARCIDAVRASEYPQDRLQVIYVDGGSQDASVSIARRFSGVLVEELRHPFPSPGRGRNAGARLARMALLQFLDCDSYVAPSWFRKAIGFIHEGVGAVGGILREREPDRNFYHRSADYDWYIEPGRLEPAQLQSDAAVFGGNVLIRREALEAAGGYDESLVAGEEADLSWRMRHAGWRIVHVGEPMATHDIGMDSFRVYTRRAIRSGYAYALIACRFLRTGEKLFLPRLLRILVTACVPAAALVAGILLKQGLLGLAVGAAVALRSLRNVPWYVRHCGMSLPRSVLYALHLAYVGWPQFLGVLRYFGGKLFNRPLVNRVHTSVPGARVGR